MYPAAKKSFVCSRLDVDSYLTDARTPVILLVRWGTKVGLLDREILGSRKLFLRFPEIRVGMDICSSLDFGSGCARFECFMRNSVWSTPEYLF